MGGCGEGFLWLNYKNQKCSNLDLTNKAGIPENVSPWRSPSDQKSNTYFRYVLFEAASTQQSSIISFGLDNEETPTEHKCWL